jgi:bifunctional UDP-N-acetylglucosamine pyrophosphorylase / glucosamine-1-phosphate N-acetyltransferase
MTHLSTVIMAAGQGTRMKTQKLKVLHTVGGQTLVEHVVSLAHKMKSQQTYLIVPKAHEAFNVVFDKSKNKTKNPKYVVQSEQKGTGHALQCALKAISQMQGNLLVLSGDQPFVSAASLKKLVAIHQKNKAAVTLLTTCMEDPFGLGRIVRNQQGELVRIVEEKDATKEEKSINEINVACYVFDLVFVKKNISKLKNRNKQKEYYITDLISLALHKGLIVKTHTTQDVYESFGINSQEQLSMANDLFYFRQRQEFMKKGVALIGSEIFIDAGVSIAKGVRIESPCYIKSGSKVEEDVSIEMGTTIKSSIIRQGAFVKAHSYIDHCDIGPECQVGPFCHLRPQAKLLAKAKVGNFSEVKKSVIGVGSKINHLSYIGDARIGSGVNVGAGTITCNYDGFNKFKTVLEDNVFVGSDTQFVAPVRVGQGAVVGAGTTVTKNVSKNSLVISRCYQKEIKNWVKNRQKSK